MTHGDTIAAIATAPGQGGIGIIRVSGKTSHEIAVTFLGRDPQPRYAHYVTFTDQQDDVIDQGLLLFFPGPASFTGEDVVELQIHGGPAVLDRLLKRVIALGCRQARAGEFSERAFLNDRIDLVQAEAIADLISAESEQAARAAVHSLQGQFSSHINDTLQQLTHLRMYVEAALDFPEEEIDFLADDKIKQDLKQVQSRVKELIDSSRQGRIISEGLDIALTGAPNAGKSSLLNAMAGFDSAIVSDQPGTTRDVIRERITLQGVPLHIIDTAGIRDSDDSIEQEGVRRAIQAVESADMVIRIIDATTEEVVTGDEDILVINKIDLTDSVARRESNKVWISARHGHGIAELTECILEKAGYDTSAQDEGRFSARTRHTETIDRIQTLLLNARAALETGDGEIMAEELRMAQNEMATITGEFRADDLLGKIFSEFCIGK